MDRTTSRLQPCRAHKAASALSICRPVLRHHSSHLPVAVPNVRPAAAACGPAPTARTHRLGTGRTKVGVQGQPGDRGGASARERRATFPTCPQHVCASAPTYPTLPLASPCRAHMALPPAAHDRSHAQVVMLSSTAESLASLDPAGETLQVIIDNGIDEECTVITVEGKDQPHLLMTLSGAFTTAGFMVVSASITSDDGRVLDVFRVQTQDHKKVGRGGRWPAGTPFPCAGPQEDWEGVGLGMFIMRANAGPQHCGEGFGGLCMRGASHEEPCLP